MNKLKDKISTEREGIIFLPDISGFTRFVHDTEIRLGTQITTSLLSSILETNILKLKVSEIEGDAILFYRFGRPPGLKDLINQYELMLIAFKKKLRIINVQRHLPELSLKLIVHFGPMAEYKLYGFKKLYGETVVEAHELLKNEIASENYILITKDFFDRTGSHEVEEMVLPNWIQKKTRFPANDGNVRMPFTYFLYDTDILKAKVLKEQND